MTVSTHFGINARLLRHILRKTPARPDTLAKKFSDRHDTRGPHRSHWADYFSLLVHFEKIDIRSIIRAWILKLLLFSVANAAMNLDENSVLGVFDDGEQVSLFDKAQRWRLPKNIFKLSTSMLFFTMMEVRCALFDAGFWKFRIFCIW